MSKRLTLIDDSSGETIGELGTDLLRAEIKESADPSTLLLRGDSPLIRYLMDCRFKRLVMDVEICAKCGDSQRFTVKSNTMKYEHGAWTSHVELVRSDTA